MTRVASRSCVNESLVDDRPFTPAHDVRVGRQLRKNRFVNRHIPLPNFLLPFSLPHSENVKNYVRLNIDLSVRFRGHSADTSIAKFSLFIY